jgi:hypothetical protein
MTHFFSVLAIGGAALLAAACTSDTAKSLSDGGAPGAHEDAHLPPGLTLTWRIKEAGALGAATDGTPRVQDLPPLPGVRVCVYERDDLPCATTDKDGIFVLGGFKSLEHAVLTCQKDGYVSSLRSIEAASTDMDGTGSPILMGSSDGPDPDIGVPVRKGTGAISALAIEPGTDGGVVLKHGTHLTLSPAGGDGPFFTNSDSVFDRAATTMVGGVGFFFNLSSGDYELTFDDETSDCAPISFPFGQFGFPSPPHGVRFKVLDDYVTDQIAVLCTQKSIVTPEPDGG